MDGPLTISMDFRKNELNNDILTTKFIAINNWEEIIIINKYGAWNSTTITLNNSLNLALG